MRHALFLLLLIPSLAMAEDGGARPARRLADVTLLSFKASWCSSCRRFEASHVLELVRKRLPGLTVSEVDIDAQPELVEQYGVDQAPALLLVDQDGAPLVWPAIDLDDEAGTAAGVEKAVRRMIRGS